jgi:hypothetical protein
MRITLNEPLYFTLNFRFRSVVADDADPIPMCLTDDRFYLFAKQVQWRIVGRHAYRHQGGGCSGVLPVCRSIESMI